MEATDRQSAQGNATAATGPGARSPLLRRKAQTLHRHGRGARAPAIGKALRLALGKAAQNELGLALAAAEVAGSQVSLAELLDRVEPRALLAVLEGPGDALGLAALSPGLLAALIEVQTIGRVLRGPAPDRRPTRTDAAMSAGFIDRTMAEFEAMLCADGAQTWAQGYRFASFLDEPRPLGLLLEDCGYRLLEAALEIGGGAKEGAILLALPSAPHAAEVAGDDEARRIRDRAAADWAEALEAAVLASHIPLNAVLHRVKMPLAAVMGLTPGAVLSLPMSALSQVSLESADSARVCSARLGQSHASRALRILPDDGGAVTPGMDLASAGGAGGADGNSRRMPESGGAAIPAHAGRASLAAPASPAAPPGPADSPDPPDLPGLAKFGNLARAGD